MAKNKHASIAKPNKYSKKVKNRGCLNCSRWKIFAKAIYEDSGEICDEDVCINLSKSYNIKDISS